jgi:hypothetical protein
MEAASTPRRALVAGSIGNVVEWYEQLSAADEPRAEMAPQAH